MSANSREVLVAGVGMVPFVKPSAGATYDDLGRAAIQLALADSRIPYASVEQAYAGYVFGDSCCGQRVVYGAGMTGIPVINVNNNCSTGSTALFLARQAIASGAAECVLAVGKTDLTYYEYREMAFNSIRTAFVDDTLKRGFLQRLSHEFAEFERNQAF